MLRKIFAVGALLCATSALGSAHAPSVEFTLGDGVLTASVPSGWGLASELLIVDAARLPIAAVNGDAEVVTSESSRRSFVIPASEFRGVDGSATRYVAVEALIEMYAGADKSIRPVAAIDRAYFACLNARCTLIDWSAYALATGYAQLITLADGTVVFNLPGKSE